MQSKVNEVELEKNMGLRVETLSTYMKDIQVHMYTGYGNILNG